MDRARRPAQRSYSSAKPSRRTVTSGLGSSAAMMAGRKASTDMRRSIAATAAGASSVAARTDVTLTATRHLETTSTGEVWRGPGPQARTSASGPSRTRSTRPMRSTSTRPASASASTATATLRFAYRVRRARSLIELRGSLTRRAARMSARADTPNAARSLQSRRASDPRSFTNTRFRTSPGSARRSAASDQRVPPEAATRAANSATWSELSSSSATQASRTLLTNAPYATPQSRATPRVRASITGDRRLVTATSASRSTTDVSGAPSSWPPRAIHPAAMRLASASRRLSIEDIVGILEPQVEKRRDEEQAVARRRIMASRPACRLKEVDPRRPELLQVLEMPVPCRPVVGRRVQLEADEVVLAGKPHGEPAAEVAALETGLEARRQVMVEQRARPEVEPVVLQAVGRGNIGDRLHERHGQATHPHDRAARPALAEQVAVLGRSRDNAPEEQVAAPDQDDLVAVTA